MSIDLDRETPITISAAADLLSQLVGIRLAYKTVYNWCRYGILKIKLEYVRIGGSLFTTRQAVVRFVRAVLEAEPRGSDWFHVEGVNSRADIASALEAFQEESAS